MNKIPSIALTREALLLKAIHELHSRGISHERLLKEIIDQHDQTEFLKKLGGCHPAGLGYDRI